MLLSISDLQKRVDAIVLNIGAPRLSINLSSSPFDDGTPYISFDNNKYNYICSERGTEFSRRVTDAEDELLYWIIFDLVHRIAFQYELKHRIDDSDGRRIAFPKVIELMTEINPIWGLKSQREIEMTLALAPYNDGLYY